MEVLENTGDISQMNNNNNYERIITNENGIFSFYDNAVVFITGATGFLGKVLVEKLTRTCENINSIYILLRTKNGISIEQRYKDLLKNPIFDKIRSNKPELLQKIKPIQGDVSEPNIGLSQKDQDILSEKVNIIIHSAATVRFVEPLSEALNLNTFGTKRILDLSCKFKQLKSFVYVSTAYSNPNEKYVQEKVYPPKNELNNMLQCLSSLSKDIIDALSFKLQGHHPNTYTLTKNLAETIVSQYFGKIPICIIRPSIVIGANSEPYPGWIDNLFGPTAIAMEIYRGTVRTAVGKSDTLMDIVPVDLVVNSCISAAWHHRLIKSGEIVVYNCTSSGVQNMTWEKFTEYCCIIGKKYPSKYVALYPNFSFTSYRLLNTFWEVLTHLIPNFIIDLLLRAQGKKPIMMKMSRRIKMALLTGEYFALNNWKFAENNFNSMVNAVAASGENAYFPCDMSIFNWKDYMETYILGIRKFILKDTMDSLPAAKKKLMKLNVIYRIIQILSGYFLLKFLFLRK